MNKERRKELTKALKMLADAREIIECVRDEEQEAFDNLPEGIQYSERGEQIEQNVDYLDDVLSAIEEQEDTIFNDVMEGKEQ